MTICLSSAVRTKLQLPRKCSLPREDHFLIQLGKKKKKSKYWPSGTGFQAAVHTSFLTFIWNCLRSPRTCFVSWLQNSDTHSHDWKQSHTLQQDFILPITQECRKVNRWMGLYEGVGKRMKPQRRGDRAEHQRHQSGYLPIVWPWQASKTLHASGSSNARMK